MTLKTAIKWLPPSAFDEMVIKWNFDQPKSEQSVDRGNFLRIKGWVVGKDATPLQLVIKQGKKQQHMP